MLFLVVVLLWKQANIHSEKDVVDGRVCLKCGDERMTLDDNNNNKNNAELNWRNERQWIRNTQRKVKKELMSMTLTCLLNRWGE